MVTCSILVLVFPHTCTSPKICSHSLVLSVSGQVARKSSHPKVYDVQNCRPTFKDMSFEILSGIIHREVRWNKSVCVMYLVLKPWWDKISALNDVRMLVNVINLGWHNSIFWAALLFISGELFVNPLELFSLLHRALFIQLVLSFASFFLAILVYHLHLSLTPEYLYK